MTSVTTDDQKKILKLYADWHKAGKSEKLSVDEVASQSGMDPWDIRQNLTKLESFGYLAVQRIPSLNYTCWVTDMGLEAAGG